MGGCGDRTNVQWGLREAIKVVHHLKKNVRMRRSDECTMGTSVEVIKVVHHLKKCKDAAIGRMYNGDFGRSDKGGPPLKEKCKDAAIGRMYNGDFGRSDKGGPPLKEKCKDAAIGRMYNGDFGRSDKGGPPLKKM